LAGVVSSVSGPKREFRDAAEIQNGKNDWDDANNENHHYR
jgi:hypothetical protein